jgi:shikimate kinase
MRVSIVGPCGSGKSTLVSSLRAMGYDARECVQEHSYVPTMWQRISRPDVLIYLDVGLPSLRQRLPRSDWTPAILDEQMRRLSDARARCHLYVATDDMTADQVLAAVTAFLQSAEASRGHKLPAGDPRDKGPSAR